MNYIQGGKRVRNLKGPSFRPLDIETLVLGTGPTSQEAKPRA
jgi:hypothetical protein